MIARCCSTLNITRSPVSKASASRTDLGIVTWPFEVTRAEMSTIYSLHLSKSKDTSLTANMYRRTTLDPAAPFGTIVLMAALDADPGAVNLKVGDDTMLELMTQPEGGVPSPEIVGVLIDAGAYLDRALNLAGCWNLADLCTQLLAAGADPAARADAGITPLESAAMHSSTEAAGVLVAHGLHRRTLWLAAAAGLLAEVQRWVGPDGSLLADPGPYRPDWADVGRPAGAPPTYDPAEIVGEAFVFAALNDRRGVVDCLLDAGVDIDSRPYQETTALHFAIQFQRPDMVRHLLDRGASVTIEDANFGSDAAGWAHACDDGSEAAASIRAMVGAVRAG